MEGWGNSKTSSQAYGGGIMEAPSLRHHGESLKFFNLTQNMKREASLL